MWFTVMSLSPHVILIYSFQYFPLETLANMFVGKINIQLNTNSL